MIKVLAYGSGNVKAITSIYKELNIPCEAVRDSQDLCTATKLVLPGVGSFDHAMMLLEKSGMLDPLNRLVVDQHIPVLGVCVGMQIMAERSEEGAACGLGWIKGEVVRINTENLMQKPKLPHMGWNSILAKYDHSIFDDVDCEKGFYFLHSYRLSCSDDSNVLATADYGGVFTAAVKKGNVFGFQFHPEKSHRNGIRIFRNFAAL